ncbi:unnamed protein product [Rotaria socialis]|uniref:C3H1-type domain-containing protein n=1 Tax=Rotaria socialis TaxID=392032 RepID=A0A820VLP8_9BILA|nr:unnamed protein product [Rotaria socialis]CAF4236612.1 unnamed protein product [Rotaria socialis]CAF4503601.1 unnamed protein product [Rotaria socialis]
MHLFDKLRASFRRKPNKIELSLSQQIENLLSQSNDSHGDHRLLLLRLVYEHRSRQFDALNVPSNDSKRVEFERSMLKSLLAITSSSSGLPTIIIELGQQRQRIKLNKVYFTLQELIELFSQVFQMKFDLQTYEILLSHKRLDSMTRIDFTQYNNYQRFKIQLKNNRTTELSNTIYSDKNEIASLKQRLNIVSNEIQNIALLINSIHRNYRNIITTLTDEDNQQDTPLNTTASNEYFKENRLHHDLTAPPGFKPLPNHRPLNASSLDSQSTDEGIDRDAGSLSVFESAHSDHEYESVYFECREDSTLVNQPNSIMINNNSKPEWRNQSYNPRSRSHWNINKVKYQKNYNQEQFGEKPRLKKPINLNKVPLPVEKKKNIPCKYAAGGNCKRGKSSKSESETWIIVEFGARRQRASLNDRLISTSKLLQLISNHFGIKLDHKSLYTLQMYDKRFNEYISLTDDRQILDLSKDSEQFYRFRIINKSFSSQKYHLLNNLQSTMGNLQCANRDIDTLQKLLGELKHSSDTLNQSTMEKHIEVAEEHNLDEENLDSVSCYDSSSIYNKSSSPAMATLINSNKQKPSKTFNNNNNNIQTRIIPCKYAVRGNCRLGDKCLYLHDEECIQSAREWERRL